MKTWPKPGILHNQEQIRSVLIIFDPNKSIKIHTDASAVLLQINDGKIQAVASFSK